MDSPTWPATYLFSGAYNPFTHIYSNAPRAHVVIKESGQLQITGRVVFYDLGRLPPAAQLDTDTPRQCAEEYRGSRTCPAVTVLAESGDEPGSLTHRPRLGPPIESDSQPLTLNNPVVDLYPLVHR